MQRLSSFVAGRWVEGQGAHAALVNPATEEPLAEANADGIDMGEVLHTARAQGGPALRAMTFAARASLLKEMSRQLHAAREELLDLAQLNCGATRSDAKFDVDGAIGTLAAYAGVGEQLAARAGERTFLVDGDMFPLARTPRHVGQHVWTSRVGVAVHVNAFNFPAWGTFEKVAAAFLAGVPVISKPATATALVAWRATRVLVDAGILPSGSLQLICGGTGDLLGRLGGQDGLAFTGSNATGAMLRATPGFAARGVRVNVEADSLNAAVFAPDVEPGSDSWNALVRHIVTDMTQKTGQKCTAIRRILVPRAQEAALREALLEALHGVVVGNTLEAGVTMGPVSTAGQLRDVVAGVQRLVDAGATLHCGGPARIEGRGAPAGRGYFVAPTLLSVPDGAAAGPVHEHEVFGPVATLLPYDGSAGAAACILSMGQGSLVSTVASDDRAWLEQAVLGAAPFLGRLMLVSTKVADQPIGPGMVLPSLVHGGPGRAGGGEELGGERGLAFYLQRTALQGDRVIVGKLFGNDSGEA
ncbi:MAG: hypothetical protein RLZZ299_236 [Pseudomonadota bacterium]|jgi:3,4-dehydroadipyl-CoA semialdehyde dehydrogenase